jgi:cobalt-zinc-cadmium efflux system protein
MHSHSHPHAHSHSHSAGTAHAHPDGGNERRVALAALITGLFMFAEVAGGLVSGSLALIADAGHMLTDCAGLTLAWLGFRLARRPADRQRSYGYGRFGVLVAFTNGLALFAIAAWIVVEAIDRLRQPVEVLGGVMLAVAVVGLIVNLVSFRLLSGGDHGNLNVKAAMLHVAGDLLGSVATLVAALVIMATGWTPIDPILSVLVSLLILWSAWHVVRDAGHILLEGTPSDLDAREIGDSLKAAVPEVLDVHHVHAWSLSQDRPVVTLHARIGDMTASLQVIARIKAHLRERFGVAHATVELECEGCADAKDANAGAKTVADCGHGPDHPH